MEMNAKRWCLLLIVYVLYLIFGALTFIRFEEPEEQKRLAKCSLLRREVKRVFLSSEGSGEYPNTMSLAERTFLLAKLGSYNGPSLNLEEFLFNEDNSTDGSEEPCQSGPVWSFYNAFFFCFTVVTTIGYGHISPTSKEGKMLTIPYSLIGIPINGILVVFVADYFSSKLLHSHRLSKSANNHLDPKRKYINLTADLILYLIPGFLIFIILPAGFFVVLEDWEYDDAVYYAVITLTTIGFGDMVALRDGEKLVELSPFGKVFYKGFLIMWIIFGMGYFGMIIGFISKALRSRRVRRLGRKIPLIRKLRENQREVRQLINVIQFNKLRPVFLTKEEKLRRKEARLGMRHISSETPTGVPRNRAGSDVPLPSIEDREEETKGHAARKRRFSDTDLEEIDQTKTFQNIAKPHELEGPLSLYITLKNQADDGESPGTTAKNLFDELDAEDRQPPVDMTDGVGSKGFLQVPNHLRRTVSSGFFGLANEKERDRTDSLPNGGVISMQRKSSSFYIPGEKDVEPRLTPVPQRARKSSVFRRIGTRLNLFHDDQEAHGSPRSNRSRTRQDSMGLESHVSAKELHDNLKNLLQAVELMKDAEAVKEQQNSSQLQSRRTWTASSHDHYLTTQDDQQQSSRSLRDFILRRKRIYDRSASVNSADSKQDPEAGAAFDVWFNEAKYGPASHNQSGLAPRKNERRRTTFK